MHRQRCVGWIVAAAGILIGCYRPPDQGTLVRGFFAHRSAFERLLDLAAADRGYRRISRGRIPPIGMSAERFMQYTELFREAGIGNGLTRFAGYPRAVFLIVSSEVPIGGKGRSIGYAYSPEPLAPLADSVRMPALPFEIHRGGGHRATFRRLDGGWYLYCDADW